MMVGILALQGDFQAHGKVFEALGVDWREVVSARDFEEIQGLVIPGGESTTLLKLMDPACREAIIDLAGRGGAIYGTCAGALLLARKMENPTREGLGLINAVMTRNGYGRQVDSFMEPAGSEAVETDEAIHLPAELVFIRAPLFKEIGPEVKVLARVNGLPVYVQQGRVMATTFHPELTRDPAIHERFVHLIQET